MISSQLQNVLLVFIFRLSSISIYATFNKPNLTENIIKVKFKDTLHIHA